MHDQLRPNKSGALYIKCSAILLLFLFSVLIVACGGGVSANTNPGSPPVTVTINLNGSSPTPTAPPYSCNAWATDATPAIGGPQTIGVYAKYTHNVNGNPQGVAGAFAIATVAWPDGNLQTYNAATTPDGLAVFPVSIAGRTADLNLITTVTVSFSGGGAPACQVPQSQAAFFTLVNGTGGKNGSPTASPTGGSPVVGPTPPFPFPTPICPTPKPFRTPKPCH